MDIAAAQWRFGALGRLQRVDLALQPGADAAAVQAAVRAVLPADAQLVTPQSEAQRSDSLSRAYRVNLEMLAMVALLGLIGFVVLLTICHGLARMTAGKMLRTGDQSLYPRMELLVSGVWMSALAAITLAVLAFEP